MGPSNDVDLFLQGMASHADTTGEPAGRISLRGLTCVLLCSICIYGTSVSLEKTVMYDDESEMGSHLPELAARVCSRCMPESALGNGRWYVDG